MTNWSGQRGEKPRMTSWSGQRGSKPGDLVGHGLKQKQSSATLGTDSSVHEAADKKGGARQQVKVPFEGVNRQQQQVATKCDHNRSWYRERGCRLEP
ncbi:hypothetical protein FRX31_021051 [Thalictrum thalictroides]|uniref:Uncharacterized protein n=1 Tax=Thalictrum thalictroides TaxID=46969 RepID=A0A7J6VYE6_THATH|nr:hypothetical protein FRX31_021051 [Thalictrum thalictroides]